jgi:hypothetical protein
MRSSVLGSGWKLRGFALGRPSKSLDIQPVGAFPNQVEFVGFYVPECLLQTAGPLDLIAYSIDS